MENNKNRNDEIDIDLRQIISVIFSKIVVILLSGLIFGLLVFLGSKLLLKPEYKSSTSLYVLSRQSQGTTTYSDVQTSTQLTQDYKILVTSRNVLEKVISELKLNKTYTELADDIQVSSPTSTRVLNITVKNTDPYKAKEIVDKVASISSESICDIMQIEQVNVIEEGNVPTKPSSPNCTRNAAIALVLGIIVATVIVVLRFMLNDTIHTSEDIEKYLGLSTLAFIPLTQEMDENKDKSKKKKKKTGNNQSRKGA